MTATTVPATGIQIGYARVSTGHQSLDQQLDALTEAGVDPDRIYRDKLSGTSTREQRPGLAALLDYARPGDAIVVVGIDRLGRNAAEVMTTIRELRDREIVLRSRCGKASTRPTPQGAWLPGCSRAWPNLNLAVSAGQRRGRHAAHAGSTSDGPRCLMRRRRLWRSGCTPMVSRRARLRLLSA